MVNEKDDLLLTGILMLLIGGPIMFILLLILPLAIAFDNSGSYRTWWSQGFMELYPFVVMSLFMIYIFWASKKEKRKYTLDKQGAKNESS